MLRRTVLVLSAVAVVLLGLEKVGVFEFVPRGDVRFQATAQREPDGRAALLLRSDAGELSCWLSLIVRWDGPDAEEFEASIPSGEALVVTAENVGVSRRWVSISKAPDPQKRTPFTWAAGLPVRLVRIGPASGSLLIEDWTVHSTTQPSDSRDKARLRAWWTKASWVMIVLASIGAAVTAWPKKEEPPVASAVSLVRTIISGIDGVDENETTQLRTFLKKVLLESVPVQEALDALRIPSNPYRVRPQFVARARRVFLERISAVKGELDAFGQRLNVQL